MKLATSLSPALAGLLLVLLVASFGSAQAQPSSRIEFNGHQLFLNGSNVAWIHFANDTGPGIADTARFRAMFDSVHAHGGNSLRWWLHTSGANTPQYNTGGRVIGPGTNMLLNLKLVMDLAWQRKIGLMLCLWSHDMMNMQNASIIINRSQLLLSDTSYTHSYINNALIPMVNSVKGHPALLAWEIFNEPEGFSNEYGWSTNYHVPMTDIQTVTNLCAGAIHRADPSAKVTTGAWALTSLTDANPVGKRVTVEERLNSMSAEEKDRIETVWAAKIGAREPASQIIARYLADPNYNYYRDDRLIQVGGDPLGTLDFYTDHYYNNGQPPFICPFINPCSTYGLTKPLAIAEFADIPTLGVPYLALYDTLYAMGYAGALSWSLNEAGISGLSNDTMIVHTYASLSRLFSRYPQSIDADPVSGTVYSFTAAPGTIDSGETSILTWKTALGTSATLNGSSVATQGTLTVSPPATVEYTLLATGTVADTMRRTVTVYKSGHIIAFSCTPSTIAPGESAVLKWRAAHGSLATLNGTPVNRTDSMVVQPDSTKVYTLITSGTERDTTSITVLVVPVNSLNRALLKTVTVSNSSTTPGLNDPQAIVDGDANTQWSSPAANRQWVRLDLGQQFQVGRVVIRWGDSYATTYRVKASADGSTGPPERSVTNGAGGTEILDTLGQSGRYVLVSLDARSAAGSGFVIREIEVYGVPVATNSVSAAETGIPDQYVLLQNYPNPFNPATTIRFGLPARSHVQLTMYNTLGQRVSELVNGELEAGYHDVQFNASGLASGVYFYRIHVQAEARLDAKGVPGFTQTLKLLLVR
jgi:hypothetical protein